MPNVSSFGAQTDNAVVSGTVTDRQMVIPEVPPQGLMSVGPRVTPNFVKEPWSKLRSYNFFDVVKDVAGSSYIAIKPVVPTNTELTDEEFWFKWSDPDAQLNELQEIVKLYDERINSKAPINHASEETVYGIGNAINYGHIKLADDDTPMQSDANAGVAATPKMVDENKFFDKMSYSQQNPITTNEPPSYTNRGLNVHKETYGQYNQATGASVICNTEKTQPEIYGGDTRNLSIYAHKAGEAVSFYLENHSREGEKYNAFNFTETTVNTTTQVQAKENTLMITSDGYIARIKQINDRVITTVDGWWKNGNSGVPVGSDLTIDPIFKPYLFNGLLYVDGENSGSIGELSVITTSKAEPNVAGLLINMLHSTQNANYGLAVTSQTNNYFQRGVISSRNFDGFESTGSIETGFRSSSSDRRGFSSFGADGKDAITLFNESNEPNFIIKNNGTISMPKFNASINPNSDTNESVYIFSSNKTLNLKQLKNRVALFVVLGGINITLNGNMTQIGKNSAPVSSITVEGGTTGKMLLAVQTERDTFIKEF